MKKKNFIRIYTFLIMGMLLIFLNSCEKDKNNHDKADGITDVDGNIYHEVTIGFQTWMAENLKVTHFRNGDPITNVTDNTEWANLKTAAYCNYNNAKSNATDYGRLYNWYAVDDSRNLAPKGWHVPTHEEWTELIDFLGGRSVAGGKLKENGYEHWFHPNTQATNEYGFTALPGGIRAGISIFTRIGEEGHWWTSSTADLNLVTSWLMYSEYSAAAASNYYRQTGMSVRCIKDED